MFTGMYNVYTSHSPNFIRVPRDASLKTQAKEQCVTATLNRRCLSKQGTTRVQRNLFLLQTRHYWGL